ncbi:MAG: cytidine deaminase [Myxococcota bacterium]|nr:cytidine deaminase [Myxococcota bacterium]MEC9388711.1 cytidine deaminase [Myxococcota bacterium]
MVTDKDRALLEQAFAVQANAHAPFSNYPVGSAVRTEDGTVFTGCNVESASFSLTCCAERVAVFKAVSEGHTRMMSCAIVTIEDEPALPCGACRQVLWEFGGDLRIVLGNAAGKTRVLQLADILPGGFTAAQLPDRNAKRD